MSMEDSQDATDDVAATETPDAASPGRQVIEDDLDDDRSEPDDELESQAMIDTQVVNDLKVIDVAEFDDTHCLVELSMRVKGHPLLCGYPRDSCTTQTQGAPTVVQQKRSPGYVPTAAKRQTYGSGRGW
jgi:hypothetical protein